MYKRISRHALLSLPPSLLAITSLGAVGDKPKQKSPVHPNILLIMVDQMQTPPDGYGPEQGAVPDLKEILGFRTLSPSNTYTGYFQGLMRLRQHAVVLKRHYTASSASVPSRCSIMTGQYPDATGVKETDGLFKTAMDVPYLDSITPLTIGDWFRAAGYSTHYFGKWHVSDPDQVTFLEPWGFSDWESSYPEPHGGGSDNLGVYRDVVFADRAVDFLNTAGSDTSGSPWFTVASFVNPHDISAWPLQWQLPGFNGVVPWANYPPVPVIPQYGEFSLTGIVPTFINGQFTHDTISVPLNPDGFPQNNSLLPPTFNEDLVYKPQAQQDYSTKWGLAWAAKTDYNFGPAPGPYASPHPFQLQGSYAEAWALSYIQFYFYCQYLADLQIRRVLQALDENGLTENTIIVFLSDHGDMTASHGSTIQKWHNAYEESIRVPMIVSSPLVNPDPGVIREIVQPTSSIDVAPTLLGLAGIDKNEVRNILKDLHRQANIQDFSGIDLTPHINGTNTGPIMGHDGNARTGVLFMTDDMITELSGNSDTSQYDLFLQRVDSVINIGIPIVPGPVRQPNNVRAYCTGDWKLVQYTDPDGVETDQWELYCLASDPTELVNLVEYTTDIVRHDVSVPGMTTEQIQMKNDSLRLELARAMGSEESAPLTQQAVLLSNSPNPFIQRTTVSIFIPGTGTVRLAVTDVSGREVLLVADRTLTPGTHRFTVDGTGLPPGIYFCTMKYLHQHYALKMILMR